MSEQQPICFDAHAIVITGASRCLGAAYARLIAAGIGTIVVHDAGAVQDGSGFDPSVADAVTAEINAAGSVAAACYENLEDAGAKQHVIEFAASRFACVDVLIDHAGLVVFAGLQQTDLTVRDRMVATGTSPVSTPFGGQCP